MKARLKNVDCIQHEPIQEWLPDSLREVDFVLCLHIGPDDSDASERFYVNILTQEAFSSLRDDQLSGKALVFDDYAWDSVMSHVRSLINDSSGNDWPALCDQLRQHFDWEYENFDR